MKKRATSEDEKILFRKTVERANPSAVTKKSTAKAKSGKGGLDGHTRKKLQDGILKPEVRLDLHGFTQNAAHQALLIFLARAHKSGVRLALVITGKGKSEESPGVLKAMVPRWLKQPEFAVLIAGIEQAHIRHGGGGALYVYLRK